MKDLLTFSKWEIHGLLVLFPVCILSFWIPGLIVDQLQPKYELEYSDHYLDSLYTLFELKQVPTEVPVVKELKPELFDPNSIKAQLLIKFGLDSSIANRIIRYRNKGGQFRKKEDLMKIYGMDSFRYSQLEPYISIKRKQVSALQKKRKKKNKRKKSPWVPIDLNLADTMDLIKVYGIGPVLSRRILRYRDKLGGYIHMRQLLEVYGLEDSVRQAIIEKFFLDTAFIPKQINLNKTEYEQLKSHPYISYSMASHILRYREMHGDFKNISDLRKIHTINDSSFKKLKPYITN